MTAPLRWPLEAIWEAVVPVGRVPRSNCSRPV